jgi:meso-butanediol dehydrogenase/(S,S)-butanediol dehydrogenase/diacetyl reductase
MSRVGLVTGAAQGIGRAIALRLAKDGLNVALNDLEANSSELQKLQQEIEQLGRKSIVITADVSVSESVEKMMIEVAQQLGSLDVCIFFTLCDCFNRFLL